VVVTVRDRKWVLAVWAILAVTTTMENPSLSFELAKKKKTGLLYITTVRL
jgi:hypothetical protein